MALPIRTAGAFCRLRCQAAWTLSAADDPLREVNWGKVRPRPTKSCVQINAPFVAEGIECPFALDRYLLR